jgi:integrase/recombinase XerC
MTILDDFKKSLIEQGKSEWTVAGYLADLRLFSTWFQQTNGDELTPERLTPTDVKQYRAYLQTVIKAKPATINRRLAALRIYGAIAVSLNQAAYNPAEGIRSVETQELAPRWLGKQEQMALVREVERRCQSVHTAPARLKAVRDRAIVILLLNTGMRIGELISLETGDLVITERRGELVVRKGKGNKSRRIPLNLSARKALQEWLAMRPVNGVDRVFTNQAGKELHVRMAQHMIKGIAARANVENVTPHTLRHTYAHNLVEMGNGLGIVATLLGHSRLETTMIYTTPGIHELERAVNTLDN